MSEKDDKAELERLKAELANRPPQVIVQQQQQQQQQRSGGGFFSFIGGCLGWVLIGFIALVVIGALSQP